MIGFIEADACLDASKAFVREWFIGVEGEFEFGEQFTMLSADEVDEESFFQAIEDFASEDLGIAGIGECEGVSEVEEMIGEEVSDIEEVIGIKAEPGEACTVCEVEEADVC